MFDQIFGSLFGQNGNMGAATPQPTPDPWDPSTEQFWEQVRANQAAATEGRTAERIPPYGLPPPKQLQHVLSAYDGSSIAEGSPSEYSNGGPAVSPEGLDVQPKPIDYHADEEAARVEKPVDDGREGYKPGTIGDATRKGATPEQVEEIAGKHARNSYNPMAEAPGGKVTTVGKPRALSLREEQRISTAAPAPGGLPNFSGPPRQVGKTWTSDPRWRVGLTDTQKAAAMALMEADTRGGKPDLEAARNALGAMLNRAAKTGVKLGEHVSRAIYQPTIEPAQWARLNRIIRLPEFAQLTALAEARVKGTVGDWVKGATHFLAHESVMMKLSGGVRPDPYNPGQYVGNSRKYYSWPKWTGFDAKTGSYRGVVFRDKSHAFLTVD